MSVVERTGEALREHDYVALERDVRDVKRGTEGTVVAAYPDRDAYLVEVVDADGHLLKLVTAHRADLALLERAG